MTGFFFANKTKTHWIYMDIYVPFVYMSFKKCVEGWMPDVYVAYLRRTGMERVGGDEEKNQPQENRDVGNIKKKNG